MVDSKEIERVGVLFVHGVGEQRRFQHLEHEARERLKTIEVSEAIDTNAAGVEFRQSRSSAYGADRLADEHAPVAMGLER